MKKVYISGKITGLPMQEVIDKFEKAEHYLMAQGYSVINPVKLDHSNNPKQLWHVYMQTDIKALMDCHIIALLPCWHKSPGAIIEFQLAQHLNYPTLLLEGLV